MGAGDSRRLKIPLLMKWSSMAQTMEYSTAQNQPCEEGEGNLYQVPMEQAEEQGGKNNGEALAERLKAPQDGAPKQQLLHHRRDDGDVQDHAGRTDNFGNLNARLVCAESPQVEDGLQQVEE